MFWNKKPEPNKELALGLEELTSLFKRGYLIFPVAELPFIKNELLRPYIEQQRLNDNSVEAERINIALKSKGEKIRRAREQYKEDFLKLEREGKDTDLVKAKLEILDKLMEGVE